MEDDGVQIVAEKSCRQAVGKGICVCVCYFFGGGWERVGLIKWKQASGG